MSAFDVISFPSDERLAQAVAEEWIKDIEAADHTRNPIAWRFPAGGLRASFSRRWRPGQGEENLFQFGPFFLERRAMCPSN